ncbi:elongation factor 1-gamma [Cricetulus griseus]|uniref:Elongation factor 1-gamma n=1 Tax=Cricetulus griseus TaxID=10029 RepID=A0A061HXF8_CRIGR|nr:elongation factor 1-gamma [Cricetulus griseus]
MAAGTLYTYPENWRAFKALIAAQYSGAQPQFRAVLGEVKLCEKMAQFDAEKFAESQPKKDTLRKEKGSQKEKQKPQAEQKEEEEEKKAAAPAPEEEMDESFEKLRQEDCCEFKTEDKLKAQL